jgi:DNA polymerase-1
LKTFSTAADPPTGATESLWVYNGLDCCITLEVRDALRVQLDEVSSKVYEHSCSLQGPVLEMECRGVLVDQHNRDLVIEELLAQQVKLTKNFDRLVVEGLGLDPINPNSPKQLMDLFYNYIKLTPIRKLGKVTVGRPALEKLQDVFYAEPLIKHILALRDLTKKLSFLRSGIDSDGRIRTSFNIAGTSTFRFSSSESPFGSGTNLQNVTEEMRSIFVSDPGYKMAYIDLKQVQSYIVGASLWNLLHDGSYLDACESGDLHTMVCQLCWPELPWTQDYKANRKIADRDFYRVDSYRQASKKLGHATNFRGSPPEISRQVHIPLGHVIEFQKRYFQAFPGIKSRFEEVRKLLLRQGFITTFVGQRRKFFGRTWDDQVLKDALAFEPQAVESHILCRGMLNIWREDFGVQPLLQEHDALVLQYPEERENEVIPRAMELMTIPIPLMYDRILTVPVEAFVGWNWGHQTKQNPDGLVEFNGNDKRKRSTPIKFLDRIFS